MRPQADIERDLARLADGSLAPERARELEAQVAESPELSAMLADQRSALEALRSLDQSAPHDLRMRIEAMREGKTSKPRTRRFGLIGGLATAAAILAVALIVVLGAAGGPTLSQASAFTLKPSSGPAPGHSFDGALDLNVDGVPYPYWDDDFGWKASGSRIDKFHGRTVTTVFYKKGNQRIGYSIVSGEPVSVPGSATVTVKKGMHFRSTQQHGATVVTWQRRGHTCILAGVNVKPSQLVKLGAWRDKGQLPYASS